MIVSAGFIIFRRTEQRLIEYLLLQHSTGRKHWTPPKGHLDGDESPLQAAERETKEEAGLDKDDYEHYDKFQGKITYDSSGRQKDVYYYLGCLRNPDQQIKLSHEHQNLSWLNLQDACSLLNQKEHVKILQQADEFIQNLPEK